MNTLMSIWMVMNPMSWIESLNQEHLDVFKEIGNIGAGNAATALATMLDRRMTMRVPQVEIVPFQKITDILDGPESIVAGVLVGMSGDMKGSILLVMSQQDAATLISILIGKDAQAIDLQAFSEEDTSALTEIANILVGSYISAISAMTGLLIIPTVPELTVDMAGAIMSVLTIEYGKLGDAVLFLETAFYDSEASLAGHFFLIPDLPSYTTLIQSLGITVG